MTCWSAGAACRARAAWTCWTRRATRGTPPRGPWRGRWPRRWPAGPRRRAAAAAVAVAAAAGGSGGAGVGRVKSAPPARARKLKTAAARAVRLRAGDTPAAGHSDSSRDSSREREKDKEKDKKGRNGRRGVARAPGRTPSEVVTMVSLLSASDSPPESDAEADPHHQHHPEPDRHPGILGLGGTAAASLRGPAGVPGLSPAPPAPATSAGPAQAPAAAADRKPKSVWFQPSGMSLRRLGPELCQSPALGTLGGLGTGGALGALGAGAGTGLGLGLASEKRAPSVEARTAKRRLTRTLSEPAGSEEGHMPHAGGAVGLQIPLSLLLRATEVHEDASPEDADDGRRVAGAVPAAPGPRAAPRPASQDEDDREGSDAEPAEPPFSTPKERECWELFKKMSDKGITVSYDTVLRGMLTPTEYRMRRNSLLTGC
ncbi:hypothetical protein ONE63_009738 [Megalurothrips usitatus]|uniref:Uncharacterized protein n=1 Tax=Megalurothrips usitatus TaxID=439358 RepID=A0AAV7XHH8_9NEOP|nr:hypothetical protein ONE63_009738 [Megalurothrips usitatus]